MKQPELGKKILELRLAKGMTQGELAEKSKLSLRTIQRIESGKVAPRSYTVKLIFANLDYPIYDSFGKFSYKFDRSAYRIKLWLEQFYKYVLDLFNLKINTMKKITILSVIMIAITLGLLSITGETNAQSVKKVRKTFDKRCESFMRWFNNGDIDSLMTLYRDDACILAKGCGKPFVKYYYEKELMKKYKFVELNIKSLSVADTIAVEKGNWEVVFETGQTLQGEFLNEWRLSGKKWQSVNESTQVSY